MVGLVDDKNTYNFFLKNDKPLPPVNLSNSIKSNELERELEKSQKASGQPGFITIEDLSHIELILRTYADVDKRKILELISVTPKSIMKISEACDIPQSTAYRKILSLIENGLIVPNGLVFKHGKKMIKYQPLFEEVAINIVRNKITITVKPATKR
jgi:predicted transcriptional regulator